jgi:biopolymer transport protein ExbD
MVPMVDCIMVLVIFLMVSSAFVNDPGIEVEKPDVSGSISGDQSALLIAISPDNRVYFDGQEIRVDQVASLIKQAAIGRFPSLIIRGDRSSNLGTFAAVYSEAKRSGIQHVAFATTRADGR